MGEVGEVGEGLMASLVLFLVGAAGLGEEGTSEGRRAGAVGLGEATSEGRRAGEEGASEGRWAGEEGAGSGEAEGEEGVVAEEPLVLVFGGTGVFCDLEAGLSGFFGDWGDSD